MQATGTATDPLGLSDTDVKTLATPSGNVTRVVKSSFFKNRANWGNSITDSVVGPEPNPDPYQHLAGPTTKGMEFMAIANHRSVGMRVMKMPAGHGTATACCWAANGTLIRSKSQEWVADGGGWREFIWDTPYDMVAETTYHFSIHYSMPDTNYAMNVYVWNNSQDTCVYPMLVSGVQGPSWAVDGAVPSFPSVGYTRGWHNYYIDPMAEWDVERVGYDEGMAYYDQFPNGGPRFKIPLIIDWADANLLGQYKALGMNSILVGGGNEGYFPYVKQHDMDFYPCLHGNDMSGPMAAVSEDTVLAEKIRGYFITDEPEYDTDRQPANLRVWRNNARKIDSTRPMYINLGRNIIENQGFFWHPPGISARDVNMQYRAYLDLVDIGSEDAYGIARANPYTFSGSDPKRYGIWWYPLQIHRMRTEISDERVPIWGEVETTSAYLNEPTPLQVERCVWSMFIAGAKGMLYFDHRFASAAVSQNFNAMLSDPPMMAKITALNAQITSLADMLLAKDTGRIVDYTSSGALAKNQGGYPVGASIPMHYTSREVAGTTYFVCQSIRDGQTTASFHIPGYEGVTLTVLGESRTVDVDGSGWFTDDFTDGDYEYHIYTTTASPVFSAPTLEVDPVINTDGSPSTGETISSTTGTWSGVPTPTFTFQWLRSTDGESTWVEIPGATSASYVLQVADEGAALRCHVTATNSQGEMGANTASVFPTAPSASPYPGVILADSPVAYWRLDDLTDSVGSLDLTYTGADVTDVASAVNDPTDLAKHFGSSESSSLSTIAADSNGLNLKPDCSVEFWFKIDPILSSGGGGILYKTDHYQVRKNSSGKLEAFVFTTGAGGSYWSVQTISSPSVNVWHHCVFVYDSTAKRIKIYTDGVLDGTSGFDITGVPFSTSTAFDIGENTGSGNGQGTAGWVGGVDEVAFYDYLLTPEQIAAHYAAASA